VPAGQTLDSYLRQVAESGLLRHYPEPSVEVRTRFDYEVGIIQAMQFSGYFLVVWDFIHHARQQGIAVGPGRGSSAGSLVAYARRTVDPIRYGLLFERF
jgi:DNA polymerase-3 subunit alpha